MRQEALVILQELLKCMAKSIAAEVPTILSHVWRLCEAAPPVFQATVIAEAQPPPAEPEGVAFETLVEQLFEFFLTVLGARASAGTPPPAAGLHAVLEKLVYNTISFMQVRLSTLAQRQ